jgi:3D (Asp-Asp-Asp) domain-containing protein
VKELLVVAILVGQSIVPQLTFSVPHDVDCQHQLVQNPAILSSYREAFGQDVQLYCQRAPEIDEAISARITGYYAEPGSRGATGKLIRPGGTAAVSRNCIAFLGSRIYVEGWGIFLVEDLTARSIGERFGVCSVDLARETPEEAAAVGNDMRTVVRVDR